MQISIEELERLMSMISGNNKVKDTKLCLDCNDLYSMEGSSYCFKCIKDSIKVVK